MRTPGAACRPRGPSFHASVDDGTAEISGEIDQKAMHEWLQFGIRGRFDL